MNFKNRYAFMTASNYFLTPNALRGCLNDWREVLKNLCEPLLIPVANRESYVAKSFRKDLVASQINKLVGKLTGEDLLLYTNSSHGTQIPDQDHDEPSGYDQALYSDDGKFISDDEIHSVMVKIPAGCLVVGLFDNCHAGTMDRALIKPQWHRMPEDVKCHAVFYFGCREESTSADAYIKGKYRGAFTYCLIQTLVERCYNVTYLELLNITNEKLSSMGFSQVAQMACTPGMENCKFGEKPMEKSECSEGSEE